MNIGRSFKSELFSQFARIGKALASGARIELLDLLSQAERTVESLAELTELTMANVSQHLQVLKNARMVEVRREGLYSYYRLADESVFQVWQSMRAVGEKRLAEVNRLVADYLKDRMTLEPVTIQELRRRMRAGDVVLIDVRPAEEFVAAHIPGAISMPVDQLKKRWRELEGAGEIVAYCRGPFCVQSDEAVEILRRRGKNARRLETGLPDWRHAGNPVVSKDPRPLRRSRAGVKAGH
jgi:rhodanese-related sulfurtransferase